MDKVLVEVFVPVLERSFDIFIPLSSPMHEVLELIKRAVKEMSDGRFLADENTAICHRENGTIININLSVHELAIKNGSKLMLI
ncbi:MAG: methyltransferase [Ruminococcaceae bacterium]|nr:methyltransferase [Oscillospiraceae bacterium]